MPTQKQIAIHLDLDQSAVSRFLTDHSIDWQAESMDMIRIAYIRQLRGAAAGHKSESGLDLTHERALTERIDREIKELTLAEKKGQLVNVAQLEPELTQMVVAFRTEVMGLVDKIKADVDAMYGINIDMQLLTDLTHDALAQLSRYDPERESAGASVGGQGGAAGEDVDHRVGSAIPPAVGEVDGQAGEVQP